MDALNNKRNPFKVPDHYFEDFSSKMQQRMAEITPDPAQTPVSKTKTVWLYLKPILSVAAMISVIYACTYFVIQSRSTVASCPELAVADETEEADLLAATLSDDDYEDLLSEISIEDLYFDDLDL